MSRRSGRACSSRCVVPPRPAIQPAHRGSYVGWVRRYVLYHGKQHPAELNDGHVGAFLTHLAVERRVSAATQRQVGSALLFLYEAVLRRPIQAPVGVLRRSSRGACPRWILSSSGTAIQALDQDVWARAGRYDRIEVRSSLERFRVLRQANLALLRSFDSAEWGMFGVHAERGVETTGWIGIQSATT